MSATTTAPVLDDVHALDLVPLVPRPRCSACGKAGPIIDGHCVPHMTQRTEMALHTVSPADLGMPGK